MSMGLSYYVIENKQCEKAPKLTLKVKPEKVDNKEPEKEPLKEENQGE